MRRRRLGLLTVFVFVIGGIGLAYGVGSYWNDFSARYVSTGRIPSTSPLVATQCLLCHTGYPTTKASANNVNAFGDAYALANYDFAAIEGLDSDGDGYSNLEEILAGTYPGDPNSKPSPPSPGDTTPPTVTSFIIPSAATTTIVPITSCMASDNVGVTGYLLTETSTAPSASATGWTVSAPTSYTFASGGAKTLWAWAKDAAGNVSAGVSGSVTITLPDGNPPTVTSFIIPSAATTLLISITSFTATDNVGVTGYLLTETGTAPSASAPGWTVSAPTSYTFASGGAKSLWAWAKDAAGNVSAGVSGSVSISVSDTTKPIVQSFTVPSTATTLLISIMSFTATDNVGVTGYLLTETSTAPSASATGWTVSAPTSYTFASAGTKTLYAWAKDAAGNVSADGLNAVSQSVTITITPSPTPSGISVDPTSLAFGDVQIQTSVNKTIKITNGLNKDVRVTGVAINQPGFTSNFSKSRELEAGKSYILTVTFNPTETGPKSAELDIFIDNQPAAAATADLTGTGMYDSPNPGAAASPVYRFYNTVSGSHFYTISAGEKDWCMQNLPVLHYEGAAYYAFTTNEPGTSPVYRFYNTVSGSHFYTISASERDWIGQNLPALRYEGMAYYAQPNASP